MKSSSTQIYWQGRLSIDEITPLRDELLAALNQHGEINIDVSDVTSFDLACLQLLCSACGSASIRSKKIRLLGASNPALTQILTDNGLNFRDNCLRSRSSICLWPQERGKS